MEVKIDKDTNAAISEIISASRETLPDGQIEKFVHAIFRNPDELFSYADKLALERMKKYHESLDALARPNIKWEELVARLTADNSEKLRHAMAMKGGGVLFGVTGQGKALIRDRGPSPVFYSPDEQGNLTTIYDIEDKEQKAKLALRDSEFKSVGKVPVGASYKEIRNAVIQSGYKLLPYVEGQENEEFEMARIHSFYGVYRPRNVLRRKEVLGSGATRSGWIGSSYLDCGENPEHALCVNIRDDGDFGELAYKDADDRHLYWGAIRYFEV